jgi:hypothetical protein
MSLPNSNIRNFAKGSFEKIHKGTSSGDYLKNKKSKLTYCNNQSCGGKIARATSYEQRNLFENGKFLDSIKSNSINPNHKHDLINNLYSSLDLKETYILTDVETNQPTCIDISLIPFYESYNVDPDSSLFGSSECTTNNYVNYMVSNMDYVPPPTILFNKS